MHNYFDSANETVLRIVFCNMILIEVVYDMIFDIVLYIVICERPVNSVFLVLFA